MFGKTYLNKSIYLLAFILIVILISPYLVLLKNITELNFKAFDQEFIHVLSQSLLQAALSSVLITFFGFLISLSFFNNRFKYIFSLSMLPLFLPSVMVVLSLVQMINSIPGLNFPYGLSGVILCHLFIYTGFVAHTFYQSIRKRVGHLSEVALIYSCSQIKFLARVVLPLIKMDLFVMMLFSFVACFLSFSVPLLVGGSDGNTLEILIYEKLRSQESFSEVFSLSVFQSVVVFFIYSFIKQDSVRSDQLKVNFGVINFKWGLIYPALIFISLFVMLSSGIFEGYQQLSTAYDFNGITNLAAGSLIVGLGVSLMTYSTLCSICRMYQFKWLQSFLLKYLVPSGAVTGFGFLIIFKNSILANEIKIILALFILQLTVVYKLFIFQNLKALTKQIETAYIFSTKSTHIYSKIIYPQMKPHIAWSSCVAAFWAIGDFSVSSILANSDFSLALTMKTLMVNYRFEAANFLALIILLIGFVIYLLFWRPLHVRD